MYDPPGSPGAVLKGCLCPTLDNAHGKGIYFGVEVVYWIDGLCPLHGERHIMEDPDEMH
jgi:hypothetical protein